MKVIFAQGNPGKEYDGTRHNVGFMALEAFAKKSGNAFSMKSKFQAEIAELSTAADKALLIKPTTFYNETGQCARSLVDFYKFDPKSDLLVIHDDLALPFGTIRIRGKGSDAGNNGIKSLNTHIGHDYVRIRIGVHADGRTDDTSFVLGRFNSSEIKILKEEIIPKIGELIGDFTADKLEETSYAIKYSAAE